MGNFVPFDTEIVDDDVPTDGKGLVKSERLVMKYENGQRCWNEPNRSTRVVMACTEKDKIWKISEGEKYVYQMEVGTAAVCEANGSEFKEKNSGKDELELTNAIEMICNLPGRGLVRLDKGQNAL